MWLLPFPGTRSPSFFWELAWGICCYICGFLFALLLFFMWLFFLLFFVGLLWLLVFVRFMGRWFYLGRCFFPIGNILLITTNKKEKCFTVENIKCIYINFYILLSRWEVGVDIWILNQSFDTSLPWDFITEFCFLILKMKIKILICHTELLYRNTIYKTYML